MKRTYSILLAVVVIAIAVCSVLFVSKLVSSRRDASPPKDVTRLIPWTTKADIVARKLLEGESGENVAKSIQGIAHPTGTDAKFSRGDVLMVGDKMSVTIAADWRGGLSGGSYTTVVVWEFDERQHRGTQVLSDNAPFAVEAANLKQLDEYFRTQVYARVQDQITRIDAPFK